MCFTFQLTEVLKDVKYINTFTQFNIPGAAMSLFEKREMFTKVRNKLRTLHSLKEHLHQCHLYKDGDKYCSYSSG